MLGETLKKIYIDDEVQRLEGALRGLAKLEPTVKEQETLVTKTLTLDEVRKELAEWNDLNQSGIRFPLEAQGHRTHQQRAVPGASKNSRHRGDPWKTCGNN